MLIGLNNLKLHYNFGLFVGFINFFPLLARISSKYQKIKTVNAY